MRCQVCGSLIQSAGQTPGQSARCQVCGSDQSPHPAAEGPSAEKTSSAPPPLKPSPVDAESLRQARARVENRLRKQRQSRLLDKRQSGTLDLARRLVAEGVRKRQVEWKRQRQKNDVSDSLETPKPEPPTSQKSMDTDHRQPAPKTTGKGLMRLMSLVAWLILGAGLVGAVLCWTTVFGFHTPAYQSSRGAIGFMPLGLLLGFAYLATGVLGFAFFWVSSLISGQLKEIRRLLLLQPIAVDQGIIEKQG